jgi:hypothetical protein
MDFPLGFLAMDGTIRKGLVRASAGSRGVSQEPGTVPSLLPEGEDQDEGIERISMGKPH